MCLDGTILEYAQLTDELMGGMTWNRSGDNWVLLYCIRNHEGVEVRARADVDKYPNRAGDENNTDITWVWTTDAWYLVSITLDVAVDGRPIHVPWTMGDPTHGLPMNVEMTIMGMINYTMV
jgi:hypothetical protein